MKNRDKSFAVHIRIIIPFTAENILNILTILAVILYSNKLFAIFSFLDQIILNKNLERNKFLFVKKNTI